MKRISIIFGIVLAISLNVFTNSCRSDDDENFTYSKSKKIKEITLEYISNGGTPYVFSAFLSYNTKNQLDNIICVKESGIDNILIDYYNKTIYKNEKELCIFELNNKGYIESLVEGGTENKIGIYEYNADGFLIKEYGLSGYHVYEYENGNLTRVDKLGIRIYSNNEYEYYTACSSIFNYSDEMNHYNIPTVLYSMGFYENYFPIQEHISSKWDMEKYILQFALHYAGLFGKSSKYLCRLSAEQKFGSSDYSATFKNSYDENGNLTKISSMRTRDSYSWSFTY